MFESLKVRNFRSLVSLDVQGLSRVNLLVGKNNVGKTSVLEAVEMLASGGRPVSLLRGPRRRGEVLLEAGERHRLDLDLRHLFSGHRMEEGASFRVTGRGGEVEATVACVVQPEMTQGSLFGDELEDGARLVLWLTGPDNPEGAAIPVSRSGSVVEEVRRNGPAVTGGPSIGSASVVFVGTDGQDVAALQQIWDGLVLTSEEDKVVAAMKIIEPSIERLAFTSRQRSPSNVAFVKLAGQEQRLPLGSFGEGTRRLLALAVYLVKASGGVLLVDEIDTGLHYTALESMWRFVIESARRLDVQVFATSHSGDCVRALAWLQTEAPELAADVSVHRIERGAERSVRYSAADIEIAARHHMDVRG